jgi:hypothetical protein
MSEEKNKREAANIGYFNGQYGVISQKTELFIVTAVETSCPIFTYTL